MGKVKGLREYDKFQRGEKLSWKQGVRAHCYICNGFEEGAIDCLGKSCPLHQFMPYKGKKTKER